MTAGTITLFGGSGFIGRYVVQRLAEKGWVIRVAVRHPVRAKFLKPLGNVGQIVPIACDLTDDRQVRAALEGADAAVNFVGILFERGAQSFGAVQHEGARRAATVAAELGIKEFVQLSAIGADPEGAAEYARSKGAGEAAVRAAIPQARILRPSIVFGPEDGFFNRFAAMARLAPALPLIGGGKTRFQPVYVADVADAVVRCLEDPATAGRTFELGGPAVLTFEELMGLMLREIHRRRLLMPLPFWAAEIQGSLLEKLPVIDPPLTRDQVEMLKSDNVVGANAEGLEALGITPHALEVILPTYLDRYRPGGRFATSDRLTAA